MYGWLGGYLHAEAVAANRELKQLSNDVRHEMALANVQEQLERQALVIRSLLEVCARKGLFTDPEFRQVLDEVDLSDGRRDGKLKPQGGPRVCPNCGKTNSRRAVGCMYCGEPLQDRELL